MILVDSLPPYCYPINYTVDRIKLNESLTILIDRLGITNTVNTNQSINLTHLPELTGEDRYKKHYLGHKQLKADGINATDFTELLEEVKDLYIGQVIQDLYQQHNGTFQGRCQLAVLPTKFNYGFHKDYYTPSRYHIPLITNSDCYWVFIKDDQKYKLHMPADDRVWFVNPADLEHDFFNDSNQLRWHLLLTSSKD